MLYVIIVGTKIRVVNNYMKVAIGSKNPVKIASVKEAFEKVWPDNEFIFEGVDVMSGVSDQPMSDEESIKGGTTRAKLAMEALDADFGVGLEGGLQKINGKWFDCGWIVVLDKNGREGVGSSVKVITPPKMMELIHQGIELGHVNDIIFKKTNSKHGNGHFGHMTNDVIIRQSGYCDGVISALATFIHPELF